MVNKFWKVLSLLITFCISIGYSNGSSNEINEDLKKLALANNDLGLKLYHIMAKKPSGNIFFSPLSISSAFGMLFAGAKGSTAEQLRSALGYDAANLQSSNVATSFNQYLDIILSKNQSANPEYVLNLANQLLLAKDINVYPEYKKDVHKFFHAYLKEVDFMHNSGEIVKEVNSWVSEQTHGKITKLLEQVDSKSILLILNAIYFKGTWKVQFDKKMTTEEKFYSNGLDANAKDIPLMHAKKEFSYASIGNLQALELPYKGDNVSMIVFLPRDRNGLADLEKTITTEKIHNIKKNMYKTKVIVTFPKFKVEYQRNLNSDLVALGAKDMFEPNVANFSGITKITANIKVYVNQVEHKAVVEVNEEGSEAAAATYIQPIMMRPGPPPPPAPKFTADHPFMFAIVDNRNDMILFLGRVTEL